MDRRQAIAAIGALSAVAPLRVFGQAAPPTVGFLASGSAKERAGMVDRFHRGLRDGGFVVGKNVRIEYLWADGHYDRLPALAAQLIERKVAVIATSGGPEPAIAAKAKTSAIPIVFVSAQDPVKVGLVASLSRPGGNATGVASIASVVDSKRVEILRELLPRAKTLAYLYAPMEPRADAVTEEVKRAAESKGFRLQIVGASNPAEIDAAFEQMKKMKTAALVVATVGLFTTQRERIVALAAKHGIPASYHRREFVAAGGLISYGPDYDDVYRQQGLYTARILKGEKPADLPVNQETRIQLVVNLKTAKALGVSFPRDFLQRVDEVIQ